MSCEDIPSLLDLQKVKKHADDFGRLMGTGTGTSTNGVTGQVRPTYNAVMANLGYTRVGTFASGGTLLNGRQTLLWDIADGGDGQEYGWSGTFLPSGKVVPPGSTPLTTGGIAVGAWISRFDPELRIQVREALRRSYAEAGYNVVGTFQAGFTYVNANDVGIDETTGRGFTGPAGPVAAGTDPASGGFVDRSGSALRIALASSSGSSAVGFIQYGEGSVARDLQAKVRERYSVGDKGGHPGTTDSSAAFQAAVDDLDTGKETITGGKIHVGIGRFAMANQVVLKNSHASRLSGLSLIGDGKQGTTLDFDTAPDTQDGLVFEQPTFCRVADLAVQKAGQAGIKLKGAQSGFGVWNHVNLQRIRTGFNGAYGVDCERGFMGHFEQVFATHAGVGTGGFRFQGLHTSMHLNNCYAASNGGHGYRINQFTYSVLNACASDSSALYGYLFTKTHSTVVNGCGSESNGRSGFAAISSSAEGENVSLTFNGIFGYQNNQSNGGYPNLLYVSAADSVRNKVVLRSSYSQAPANGAGDVVVTGIGAYLVDEDNECPAGVVAQNGGYIHHVNRTKVVRNLSVTGATTVVELSNPQGHQTDFAGEVTVVATNASPEITSAKNSAVYKLLVVKGFAVSVIGSAGLTLGGSANHPSFTWSLSGNNLQATPVGSTSGNFFFQILCGGPAVRVKTY